MTTGADPIEHLRDVNRRLRCFVDTLSSKTVTPTPVHLTSLLDDVLSIGARVENGSIRVDDEELLPAIRQYQRLLRELSRELPALQARFLAERAGLERERGCVQEAVSRADFAR